MGSAKLGLLWGDTVSSALALLGRPPALLSGVRVSAVLKLR